MKKINLMIIAILASAMAFMTSCDDDTVYLPPTVTITDGDQVVMPNTDLEIAYVVTASAGIDEISFLKDGASYGEAITKGFDNDTTHAATVFIPADQVTEDFTFTVSVTDKEDATKQATVNITVDESIVKSTEAVKIYCASADQNGYGDYASLTTFETWNHNQAEGDADIIAKIDVCYYNGGYDKSLEGKPHFVSPDDCPTEIHNNSEGEHEDLDGAKATKFLILTDGFNMDIEDDSTIKAIDMSNAVSNVGAISDDDYNISVGDVIAFELADGKKGVMEVVGGNGDYTNDSYIEVNVIVQKYAPSSAK